MDKKDFITQAKFHAPSDEEKQKLQLGSITSYKQLTCYKRSLEIYQELIVATIAKSQIIINAKYWFCNKEFVFKYLIVSVSVSNMNQKKDTINPLTELKKTYEQFFGSESDDGLFGTFFGTGKQK